MKYIKGAGAPIVAPRPYSLRYCSPGLTFHIDYFDTYAEAHRAIGPLRTAGCVNFQITKEF